EITTPRCIAEQISAGCARADRAHQQLVRDFRRSDDETKRGKKNESSPGHGTGRPPTTHEVIAGDREADREPSRRAQNRYLDEEYERFLAMAEIPAKRPGIDARSVTSDRVSPRMQCGQQHHPGREKPP